MVHNLTEEIMTDEQFTDIDLHDQILGMLRRFRREHPEQPISDLVHEVQGALDTVVIEAVCHGFPRTY